MYEYNTGDGIRTQNQYKYIGYITNESVDKQTPVGTTEQEKKRGNILQSTSTLICKKGRILQD